MFMNGFELGDSSATIGWYRSDGDFEVLVSLNNAAGHYTDAIFYQLVTDLIEKLKSITGISDIEALDYDAAVDVLDLEFVESGQFESIV